MTRISVVMLAYGTEPWLVEAVKSVQSSAGADIELVVVDNGCTSDAIDTVRQLPGVRVVRPAQNTGYSGGCDLGAAEATGDVIAFVNSDAIVEPDTLARIAAVAGQPGVGAAMAAVRLAAEPHLINTAGNPLHIAGLSWAGGNGEPATAYPSRRQVPSVSGCCFAIRRDVWLSLGGFAEEYFAYHEDTELSLRLWQRGLTCEYVPEAVAYHHYEFSRNDLKMYLVERNRLITVLTAYQPRTLLLLAPVLLLTELAMIAAAAAGGWLKPKARGWRWIAANRRWIRTRRALLQRERTVGDKALAHLFTANFTPSNVPVPPGMGVYNLLTRGYGALVRPLRPGRTR
jgi:GT2 family glycosyltransferase